MRVIAGSARRTLLKAPAGMDTRPTTDRIKETLFNMINSGLYDCRFLDLFAGSGGIGIEAISRGAAEAVFVEKGSEALACIRENLKKTGFSDRSRVMGCDVFSAIEKLSAENKTFDFIFMDPPYNKGLEREVLIKLKNTGLLSPDTVIIAEAALDTDFSYAAGLGYTVKKTKTYKTNKHVFLGIPGTEE